MPIFNNVLGGAAGSGGADAGYKIERGLRFNRADSASLVRQVSTKGNAKKFTWAGWIKRGRLNHGAQNIFSGSTGTDTGAYLCFPDNASNALGTADSIVFKCDGSGGGGGSVGTQAVFRDTSAWYHVVLVVNTTAGSGSDRVKIYVNGVEQTLVGTASPHWPNYDAELSINDVGWAAIGAEANGSSSSVRFNGDFYLADVHFLDGIAISNPDGVFGEFDATTGVWNPIEYTGNYNATVAKHLGQWTSNTTGTAYNSTNALSNAFDGNNSTGAAAQAGTSFVFTPSSPITGISKVRLRVQRDPQQTDDHDLKLNGTNIGSNWAVNTTAEVEFTVNNLTSIEWACKSNNHWYKIYKIEIYYDNAWHTLVTSSAVPGVNGYHLDFSDNSSNAALGNDAAGSNNFTVNNINATNVSGGAPTVTGSNIFPAEGTAIANLWDGQTSSYPGDFLTAANGGIITISWAAPYTGVTSLEYYSYNGNDRHEINNGGMSSNSGSGGGWKTAYSGAAIALSSLSLQKADGNSYVKIGAIRVNGTILTTSNYSSPTSITDSLLDSPTNYEAASGNNGGNYATFNPLATHSSTTLSNGNLEVTSGQVYTTLSTIGFPASGKFYGEFTVSATAAGYPFVGIGAFNDTGITNNSNPNTGAFYAQGGYITGGVSVSSLTALSGGDVVGVAYDASTRQAWFSINGTYVNSGNPATGANPTCTLPVNDRGYCWAVSTYQNKVTLNAGQSPFNTAPPSGFVSLCTQNLPDPLIANPSTAFIAKKFTANASNQTITTGFSPNFVWVKSRTNSYGNELYDSVRGTNLRLTSNTTAVEQNLANQLTSFGTDGFTLGSASSSNYTNNTASIAWVWGGGTAFSNASGNAGASMASSGVANQTAGISIVTYSYTGTGQKSYVHGLNVKPDLVIRKARNLSEDWSVYHSAMGFDERGRLNNTNASSGTTTFRSDGGDPTSTLNYINNNNTSNVVEYVFAAVPGFSSFGRYEGNGVANGPYIFTGFKPRFILLKNVDNYGTGYDWFIHDTARDPVNTTNDGYLKASQADAEQTYDMLDILSNGFKIKNTLGSYNLTQHTHVWAAFAENPFKYARAL